jgi:hypothetical protein
MIRYMHEWSRDINCDLDKIKCLTVVEFVQTVTHANDEDKDKEL